MEFGREGALNLQRGSGAEAKEDDTNKNGGERETFAEEICLVEKLGAEEEGENDGKAAHQRGDGNRRFGDGDTVKIKPIGKREKNADERNRCAPLKSSAAKFEDVLSEERQRIEKDEAHLKDELHGLDGRLANLKDIFIPNRRERRKEGTRDGAPHGAIAEEVDSFVPPCPRKDEIAGEDRQHAECLEDGRHFAI